MITANMLRRAIAKATDAEAAAMWDALGQYVENCEDCDDETTTPHLAGARDVLDRLNAELAALAEEQADRAPERHGAKRYTAEQAEDMRNAYGRGLRQDLPW